MNGHVSNVCTSSECMPRQKEQKNKKGGILCNTSWRKHSSSTIFGSKCCVKISTNSTITENVQFRRIKTCHVILQKLLILLCPCVNISKGHHTANLATEPKSTDIKINAKTSTDNNLLSGGCTIDFSIIRVQSIQFKALFEKKRDFRNDSKRQR